MTIAPPRAVLDVMGFLRAVRTAVDGISSPPIQEAVFGPPESLEYAISVSVTLGGVRVADRTNNLRSSEIRVFVIFRREVAANEGEAEQDLAHFVQSMVLLHLADRTWGGLVDSSELDMTFADDPRYQAIVGPEYRVYPVVIIGRQNTPFTVPPS